MPGGPSWGRFKASRVGISRSKGIAGVMHCVCRVLNKKAQLSWRVDSPFISCWSTIPIGPHKTEGTFQGDEWSCFVLPFETKRRSA